MTHQKRTRRYFTKDSSTSLRRQTALCQCANKCLDCQDIDLVMQLLDRMSHPKKPQDWIQLKLLARKASATGNGSICFRILQLAHSTPSPCMKNAVKMIMAEILRGFCAGDHGVLLHNVLHAYKINLPDKIIMSIKAMPHLFPNVLNALKHDPTYGPLILNHVSGALPYLSLTANDIF